MFDVKALPVHPSHDDHKATWLFGGVMKMPRYIVRFMKTVSGDNGREAEICQRYIEVDAPNQCSAAELAKTKFCEAERLEDWSIHADRFCVLDAEFPS